MDSSLTNALIAKLTAGALQAARSRSPGSPGEGGKFHPTPVVGLERSRAALSLRTSWPLAETGAERRAAGAVGAAGRFARRSAGRGARGSRCLRSAAAAGAEGTAGGRRAAGSRAARRQVKPGERVGGSFCPAVLSPGASGPPTGSGRPGRLRSIPGLAAEPGVCLFRAGAGRGARGLRREPAASPGRPHSETTLPSGPTLSCPYCYCLIAARPTVSPGSSFVLSRPGPGPPGREPGVRRQVAPAGSLLVPAESGKVPGAGHLDTAAGGFRGSPWALGSQALDTPRMRVI